LLTPRLQHDLHQVVRDDEVACPGFAHDLMEIML
jgi:hypothetical protein